MTLVFRLTRHAHGWTAWASRNGSTALGFDGATRHDAWQQLRAFILHHWS